MKLGVKVRRIKLGSAVEFYINNKEVVLYNDELWRYMNCAPFRHFSLHASHVLLSPEVDKSQYESPATNPRTTKKQRHRPLLSCELSMSI